MLEAILPGLSCVVSPDEMESALAQGYSKIYVIQSDGSIMLHHKLQGDSRYIRLKVDKIPGYTAEIPKVDLMKEVVNFLPDGKVPYALFEQILAFFRKVSATHKRNLEAMAWIMWSQERGYFIHIPDQRVSAASVSYDWDNIPAGSIIVVDIHSHNEMGAFFSGTDDRDDLNSIVYSGVIGKLSSKEPDTAWRFNYLNRKIPAKIDNIFDEPAQQTFPEEWMGQIKIQTAGFSGGYAGIGGIHGTSAGRASHSFPTGGNSNLGNVLQGPKGSPPTGKTLSLPKGGAGSQSRSQASSLSTNSFGGMRQGPAIQAGNYRAQELALAQAREDAAVAGGNLGKAAADEEEDDRLLRQQLADSYGSRDEFKGQSFGFNVHDFYSGMYDDGDYSNESDWDKEFGNSNIHLPTEQEACILLDTILQQSVPFGDDPRFDELAVELGKYRASCYLFVESASALFHEEDSLINNVIFEYFQMLSDSGKGRLFRSMIDVLPSEEKERIESYGL